MSAPFYRRMCNLHGCVRGVCVCCAGGGAGGRGALFGRLLSLLFLLAVTI